MAVAMVRFATEREHCRQLNSRSMGDAASSPRSHGTCSAFSALSAGGNFDALAAQNTPAEAAEAAEPTCRRRGGTPHPPKNTDFPERISEGRISEGRTLAHPCRRPSGLPPRKARNARKTGCWTGERGRAGARPSHGTAVHGFVLFVLFVRGRSGSLRRFGTLSPTTELLKCAKRNIGSSIRVRSAGR